ncbi:NAD(P)-binding domain-containing protein [Polyangium mundeleinium]|uniref:Glycerol-3-phosphate dehydrogenase n=1 Tax=Polyangium mundeleinium TaxID=2995306 RepID=A0ABT5EHC4_9BACT|nr:NAD(P)-binding domain-containing protein [Polyangium mundeleinium]MDC0741156.1 NAD(P)-binding domain-containing protein [Polyangium mundeleinium]
MTERQTPSVGVVGGGPWGQALATAARRTGAEVVLHSRRDQAGGLGAQLRSSERSPQASTADPGLHVTVDYAEVAKARLVVIAVPSSVARSVLRALGDYLGGQHLVVHGVRGLGVEGLETVSDLVREETPARRLGALGGPVQAGELIEGRPSAMVIGSRFPEVIAAATRAFQGPSLRVYGTNDLRGLEWASALVGCLSIGVGYAEEAGAGPGLLAALISRGVDEAARLMAAAGCEERTMLGLGGYGDLLASIALEDRPEVVLGKALARKVPLDQAITMAKLRVEAIPLIPRIVRFAEERRVDANTFRALSEILAGGRPQAMLDRMFAG